MSLSIAVAVAEVAYDQGLTDAARPVDLESAIAASMYDPHY